MALGQREHKFLEISENVYINMKTHEILVY